MADMGRGRSGVALGVIALGAVLAVVATLVSGSAAAAVRRSAPSATLSDGAVVAGYHVLWAGYGQVGYRSTSTGPEFTLQPQASTQPGETHSALVVSQRSYDNSSKYSVRVTTNRQLRTGSAPNAWETGWVVFNYSDPDHFYYLAMKTNGWELGKRDPAAPGGQRFLATGASPAATLGRSNTVAITTQGDAMRVRIDGRSVVTFTDTDRPYRGGAFGFYTEDAQVRFGRVTAA